MTRRQLIDGMTKAYNDMGFDVEQIDIEENTGIVNVTVKARASIFAINVPISVSIGGPVQPQSIPRQPGASPALGAPYVPNGSKFMGIDYADLEARMFSMGCPHDWKEHFLFSSSYHKCTVCGEEKS